VKLATCHLIKKFDDSGTNRDNIMRQNEAPNLAHKQQTQKFIDKLEKRMRFIALEI
jgi:hypothetical protein